MSVGKEFISNLKNGNTLDAISILEDAIRERIKEKIEEQRQIELARLGFVSEKEEEEDEDEDEDDADNEDDEDDDKDE